MSCTLNLAFFPPYSFVPFYVSERRSWVDNFRDTRSHCWVAWGQLWPFWKFEKERKKKYKTFMRLWNLSLFLREEGHTSWGVKSTVFPFCLVKIIRLLFCFLPTVSAFLFGIAGQAAKILEQGAGGPGRGSCWDLRACSVLLYVFSSSRWIIVIRNFLLNTKSKQWG